MGLNLKKCDNNQEILNAYNQLTTSKSQSEIDFGLLQLLEEEVQSYMLKDEFKILR